MGEREELPSRPYLPPSFAGAVAALAVAAVLLELGWRGRCLRAEPWLNGTAPAACCAAGAAAALATYCLRRRLPRFVASMMRWAGAASVAAALASAFYLGGLEADSARMTLPASAYEFTAVSEPSRGVYGISCTAEARDGKTGALAAKVRLTADEAFAIGSRLSIVGRIEPLDASEWARSRFMRGEVASVDAVRILSVREPAGIDILRDLRRAALGAIAPESGPARALVAGTVCGSTTELSDSDASRVFSATGLSHLVAVSGSHLALIASFVQRALARTRCSRGTRFAIIGIMAVCYVAFTGAAPSAVRSAAMICLTMAAQGGRRRGHGLSSLSITVIAFIVVHPGVVYDLGFQLSAASVLFIQVFGRYLSCLLARLGLPAMVAEALSLTLAAQWATLPLTLPVFGQLSLIAPLANLVVGPLMSALLIAGLIAVPVCLVAPWAAGVMEVPAALATLSIFAAEALSSVPLASIPVAIEDARLLLLYALAAAVYVRWPDPTRCQIAWGAGGTCALAGSWFGYWLLFAPASITVFDVGQADAILVREGPACLLMDAGVDDAVVSALARNHVYQIDTVVISHWDRDHWGGLPAILETVQVDRIVVANGATEGIPEEAVGALGNRAADIEEIGVGDQLVVGGFACTAVWPRKEVVGTENAESLALDVDYKGRAGRLDALLTGDTEVDQERLYAAEVGRVDVLKLGHHGSAESVDDAVLDRLDPVLAIASAGRGNSYGHPTEECVEAVERSGARMLCTVDAGDVTVEPCPNGIRVRTQRPVRVE